MTYYVVNFFAKSIIDYSKMIELQSKELSPSSYGVMKRK